MERPEPRTLLERLVQQGDRTLEEICEDFERCARHHNERDATLSIRQLGRWMAGAVDNARPASRRVAQQLWGHHFKKLLGPPDVSTEVVTQTGKAVSAVQNMPKQENSTGNRNFFHVLTRGDRDGRRGVGPVCSPSWRYCHPRSA